MKRKISIILIAVLVLVALFASGLYYLNTFYLPKKIKVEIEGDLSKALNAKVELGGIKLSLIRGVVLEKIKISEINSKTPTLEIDSVSTHLLLIPSFREKIFVIRSINIIRPRLDIVRLPDNTLNLAKFLPNQSQTRIPAVLPFVISSVNIHDAQIIFTDKTTSPNFKQTIHLKTVLARLLPTGINFSLKGELIDKKNTVPVELSGDYSLIDKKFKLNSKIKGLNVLNYSTYLKTLPVDISKLVLNNIEAECSYKANILLVKLNTDTKDAILKYDNISLSGISLKINTLFTINFADLSKIDYKVNSLEITSKINKIDASNYKLEQKNLPLKLISLVFNDVKADCLLKENNLSINLSANTKEANLKQDKNSLVNLSAKIDALINLDLKDLTKLNYKVNIDDASGILVTAQLPEKIKIELAKLEISPDLALIKEVKAKILESPLSITGKVTDFSNIKYNLAIKISDLNLALAKNIIKGYAPALSSVELSGTANTDITISKVDTLDLKGTLDLKDSSIEQKGLPYKINSINGLVNFDMYNLNWLNLAFNAFGIDFKSNASISNFASPNIDLELISDNINFSLKANPSEKNIYDISTFKCKLYNSQLNGSGTLDITNPDSYLINLSIDSTLDLKDLTEIKSIPQNILTSLNPQGKFKVTGKVKGDAKKPLELTGLFNITSDEIKVYGLSLKGVQSQIAQEEKQLKIPQATCSFYGGNISLNGLIDLEKSGFPYAIKFTADNIDLSKLKLDTQVKDQRLEGILSYTVILNGPLNSLKDLKGTAEFLIKDAYLWGLDAFKNVGTFLFPNQGDFFVFNEAKGSLSIADNKVSTDDVTITSNLLNLVCDGNIDFLGNIDLEIIPQPSQKPVEETDEYKKFVTSIFDKSGAGVVSFKVTGTIQKPKVEKKFIVMKVLNKVTDQVFSNIKNISGMIFGKPEDTQ